MSQQTLIQNRNASSLREHQREEEEEYPQSDMNKLCSRTIMMFFLSVFFIVTSVFMVAPAHAKPHLASEQRPRILQKIKKEADTLLYEFYWREVKLSSTESSHQEAIKISKTWPKGSTLRLFKDPKDASPEYEFVFPTAGFNLKTYRVQQRDFKGNDLGSVEGSAIKQVRICCARTKGGSPPAARTS